MIPIKLTFEGLYSYKKRQTIDFERLTEAGLFGIFGAVGSGKSSILEAISFALYGETERLNARDKRGYNMMNLQSNRAYIEFDFTNHEDKRFRATREFRRNSRNFDDIRPAVVTFYEFVNEQWIPLTHSNAEKIVGMNYANFKRTIIIPQGQFKEFLELGESERTRMMKEIFGLNRFDLFDKTQILYKQNQSTFDQLEGELKGYSSVTEEEIENIKKSQVEISSKYQNLELLHAKQDTEFQHLKTIKNDLQLLKEYAKELDSIQEQYQIIQHKKTQLSEYIRTQQAFSSVLIDKKRVEQDLEKNIQSIQKDTSSLDEIKKELDRINEELEHSNQLMATIPNLESQVKDLGIIKQLQHIDSEKNNYKNRFLKGETIVKQTRQTIAENEKTIESKQQLIKQTELNIIDTSTLLSLESWFNNQNTYANNLVNTNKSIQNLELEIAQLKVDLESKQLNFETLDDTYQKKNREHKILKDELQKQIDYLHVQQQISQYAHSLHQGSPCPLCGALEHPNITQTENVEHLLIEVKNQIKQAEESNSFWLHEYQLAIQLRSQFETKKELLDNEITKKKQLEQTIESHKATYKWQHLEIIDFNDFEAKKNQSLLMTSKVQQEQLAIESVRNDLQKQQANLEKYITELEKINNDQIKLETEFNTLRLQIVHSSFDDLFKLTEKDVSDKINELVSKIENYQQKNQQLQQSKQQSEQNKIRLQTAIELASTEREKNTELLSTINYQLMQKLNTSHFETIDEVIKCLQQSIDVEKVQSEIEQFTITYETLKNKVTSLQTKHKDLVWDDEYYFEKEKELIVTKNELKAATEQLATLKAEYSRLTQAFNEKSTLEKKKEAVEKRAENLKVMLNLFKGAGFVQYISTIYLQQLCALANQRFHRMTKNQLSLQLNEKGEFEIIDYLNEGKSRSVKTLSGGQAFQASLSLALALAESIPTNAKANKNFFFIDEGFGTQDLESVNIVFETLTSLQKENRIVGIISHVEELKERIPRTLSIYKDEEKGSEIFIQ